MKKEKLTRRFKRIVLSFVFATILIGFLIAVVVGVFEVQQDMPSGEKAPQRPPETEFIRSPKEESLFRNSQPQADFAS